MAFDLDKWGKLDGNPNTDVNNVWGYSDTSDSLATIKGSDYFSTVSNQLSNNDVIRIVASDGIEWSSVSQVSPTVEVSSEAAVSSLTQGSIWIGSSSNESSELDVSPNAQLLIGNGTTATMNAMSGDANIDNAGAVTLQLAEGNVYVGDNSGNASALDGSTSGQILVGDGTTLASVAVSGDATLASNGALTLNAGESRRYFSYTKEADDSAAGDAVGESALLSPESAITLTRIAYLPSATLTANDTNFATLTVARRDSAGGSKVTVASISTELSGSGGTGDWTAFVHEDFGSLSNTAVAQDEIITFEIAKSGSGVVVPRGHLQVEYTVD